MRKRHSTLVKAIVRIANLSYDLALAHEETRAARLYSESLEKYREIVMNVSESGSLAEMLEAELTLQERDLLDAHNRDNTRDIENIETGQANFAAGMAAYHMLLHNPEAYCALAGTFVPKKKPKGLPIDGMVDALRSQLARVEERSRSPHNNEAEAGLLAARKNLLRTVLDGYGKMQADVLEGERGE